MTTTTTPADTDTGDSSRLTTRIRAATWSAHQAAEHAPFVQDLLAGRLPIDSYARLAAQHHALYEALEAAVAACTDPTVTPFLAPELTRLPSLQADLTALAGPDWANELPVLPATRAYCDHLREVGTDPARLLAHHYVRYLGDLSGGQIVRRVLQRIFQLEDHRGTEFYRFPGITSPKAFKTRYRQLLDDLPWDADTQRRLIDEAEVAFEHNAAIFGELVAPAGGSDMAPVSALRRRRAAGPSMP